MAQKTFYFDAYLAKYRTFRMNFTPKNAIIFNCEKCDFNCSKKCDWDRHITTLKHKNRTTGEFSLTDSTNRHKNNSMTCVCGKEYSARNSLWYHQKKCTKYNKAVTNTDSECNGDSKNSTNNSIVLQLLQEQKAMREENKEMIKVIQQQQEQHNKQIQELLPKLQQ